MSGLITAARSVTERTKDAGTGRRYELDEWRRQFDLVAGMTSADEDLALVSDQPSDVVLERWERFRSAERHRFHSFVVARQVHSATVRTQRKAHRGLLIVDGVDGHVTDVAGVLLTVTVADCIPIYIASPETGVIGLFHAGWRGVAAGILEAGVAHLCETAEASVENLVIHCGIGICGECYEVGSEVLAAVSGRSCGGPGSLDLRCELARRAASLGIEHVSISSWCSFHDDQLFHSHRRSGGSKSRMLAYLGRPVG